MKADRVLILFAVLMLAVGGVVGVFIGRATKRGPSTLTHDTLVVAMPDSLRAQLYAEGYAAGTDDERRGRALLRPVVRTIHDSVTRTEIVYDEEAVRIAMDLGWKFDSLMAEHQNVQDLVLSQVLEQNGYRAKLVARFRERSFRGTEITRLADSPGGPGDPSTPREPTLWSRFGFGPQVGIGVLARESDGRLRFGIGGYIGIGIHYSL